MIDWSACQYYTLYITNMFRFQCEYYILYITYMFTWFSVNIIHYIHMYPCIYILYIYPRPPITLSLFLHPSAHAQSVLGISVLWSCHQCVRVCTADHRHGKFCLSGSVPDLSPVLRLFSAALCCSWSRSEELGARRGELRITAGFQLFVSWLKSADQTGNPHSAQLSRIKALLTEIWLSIGFYLITVRHWI